MQELVIRVLSDRARRAPQHRGGLVSKHFAGAGYAFPVTLHGQLLQEIRQVR